MVEAQRLPLHRTSLAVVALIALIIGCEYFFGTLQLQSTLRGSGSQEFDSHVLDTMVNETIETLLDRINDSVHDKRVESLENKVSLLEKALRAHVDENKPPPNFRTTEDVHVPDAGDRGPICASWKTNMDQWWTHHPDWYVSDENNTHYCFSPMEDREKAAVFQKLYDVQFNTDCSNVTTKPMWSSGWGADFENVIDGLKHAYDTGIPTQVHVMEGAWHYAGKKDASRPVCETKDMYCYFLNLTRCAPNPERVTEEPYIADVVEMQRGIGRWLLEYATRQQTWLRHKVYKFSKKTKVKTPCAVIHVRRADVVLHKEHARKYRPLSDYVEALVDKKTKNILLLTDDQNAIEEAKTLYPAYNWMFLNRPRHRGAEGGWENQIPSDDPMLEVIILLTIFRQVRKCSTLIHTHSNFAKVLDGEMRDANPRFHKVNLDENNPDLFSEKNALSVNVSLPFP